MAKNHSLNNLNKLLNKTWLLPVASMLKSCLAVIIHNCTFLYRSTLGHICFSLCFNGLQSPKTLPHVRLVTTLPPLVGLSASKSFKILFKIFQFIYFERFSFRFLWDFERSDHCLVGFLPMRFHNLLKLSYKRQPWQLGQHFMIVVLVVKVVVLSLQLVVLVVQVVF